MHVFYELIVFDGYKRPEYCSPKKKEKKKEGRKKDRKRRMKTNKKKKLAARDTDHRVRSCFDRD